MSGRADVGVVAAVDSVHLTVHRASAPLREPYRLSFATLTSFETLYVRLAGAGRIGLGEITPLPGYGEETIESALAALGAATAALGRGERLDEVVGGLAGDSPFVASGLACAAETWAEGRAAFERAPAPIPLAALCPGETPHRAAEAARDLAAQGYRTLKLKVAAGGDTVADDLARVRAVAAAVPAGCRLRLDANQRLDAQAAPALVAGLDAPPVSLLEQPFPPEQWQATAELAASSPVPLMLDESIRDAADLERAKAIGVRHVKLKLCKHPGMAATAALLAKARALGLGVVFGNGVQGAVGNHLEARVYAANALELAGEMNGFLKIARAPIEHRMSVRGGALHAGGLVGVERFLAGRAVLATGLSTRQIGEDGG